MRLMTFTSLPELQRLVPARRQGVLRLSLRGGLNRGLLAAAVALAAVNLAAGLVVLANVVHGSVTPAMILAGGAGYALCACLLVHQAVTRMVHTGVRRFLRLHCRQGKILICPDCGYDQRGTRSDACPECGASLIVKPAR